MKLIMNTKAAVAVLMATAMIFSSILLEPLQASAADEFAPGAPTNLTAVGVGNHIDVYWDAPEPPTDTRVPEVDTYEVSWKLSGTSEASYGAPSATHSLVRYFEIPSLTPGFYDVRIRSVAALCGASEDACRSVAVVKTSVLVQDLSSAPRIPTNLTAVGNADSISVAWVAPVVVTNDVVVDSYEIDWKLSSFGGYGTPSVIDSAVLYYKTPTTPTLTPGFYDVRVRAVALGCTTDTCRSVGVVIRSVEVGGSPEVAASPSVSFQKQTGQDFSRDPNLASNYLVWTDLEDSGDLSFNLQVGPGVTWADVRLYPFDETTHSLLINPLEENYDLRAISSVGGLLHIASLCDIDACPSVFKFEITTFKDPDGEVIDEIENIYLVRKPDPQTFILTYARDTSATLPADDPRWIQVVDSSSIGIDNASWVTKVNPDVFWARPSSQDKYSNGNYFGGWCLTPTPDDMEDDCLDPSEAFPVYRDNVLYPLWVTDLEPVSISIGVQPFNQGDWDYDPVEKAIYLTVESPAGAPLVGAVSIVGPMIVGPMRIEYDTDSALSFNVEPLGASHPMDPDLDSGAYLFEPLCDAPDCAQIYLMDGDISFGGADLGSYKIYLIAAPDRTVTFNLLEFDATPGALNAVDPERIDTRENQVIGWYPVPVVPDRSADFINYAGWEDTATDGEGYWEAYFPVIADNMKLSLDWGFGPFVSVLPSVTIFRGDSQVATASASFDSAPSNVSWTITGTSDFMIDEEGQITANPRLSAGSYSFSVVATDPIDPTDPGPPVQMTVTVVERSQVGSSENTNVPPTKQTGVGQHLPKPGSKLQADLISKVSRSKLAVGGTARFGVTGGEPGATRVFESKNTRICSVNTRGLVTAKSTGVCLISATATAQDPVFAPASAPLTKIVVLGSGLINNAKVTVFKGQVSIKASLLESLAGKSVKLAIEVKRGGKWVLVPMRREVLSKSATATFKSFAKPRPGTRVVLTIGGRAVHALTL